MREETAMAGTVKSDTQPLAGAPALDGEPLPAHAAAAIE